MKKLLNKPLFWILFLLGAFGFAALTIIYFPKAFPIVNLDISTNRNEVEQKAAKLSKHYQLGPKEYKQAASFESDTLTKTYVELEVGGSKAFNEMVTGTLYAPYTWNVRHFKPSEVNETVIRFKPNGTPYGFVEKISEDAEGPDLSAEKAKQIAEQTAKQNWDINFDNYNLIESSKEIRPSKRSDHTFVYERPTKLGQANYRLRLTASGDRLTELTHFVHIPEEFIHRYQEMRSANNTLATAASIAYMLLYVLGGCLIGLFVLFRQQFVLWKKPLLWGFFIALLQVLASINQLPLVWMNYNTTLPIQGFLISYGLQLISLFFVIGFFFSLIFMAAESLTRKAFGNHLQLWKLWNPNIASSFTILGRTVGGYLVVPFLLFFVVSFYIFTAHYANWWQLSEELFNPNILAHYFPWFSSISTSLSAGFLEECLFRAIPLACAALLGKRFGKKTWWLIAAFILQAIIFGAAHANYPAQPAYARLIELIIPSFIFGGIYLLFGLLPSIIAHFAYDVVWLSLPLFISTAPSSTINQLFIVFCTLIPLFVVLFAHLKTGAWKHISENVYNKTWKPLKQKKTEKPVEQQTNHISFKKSYLLGFIVIGFLGLISWGWFTNFHNNAPQLTISRNAAKTVAYNTIEQEETVLPDEWTPLITVKDTFKNHPAIEQQHHFIWQKEGKNLYQQLLGSYLNPPHWFIRFVKFEGPITERAEEYRFLIAKDGEIVRSLHVLPEEREGKQLTEQEARIIAHKTLHSYFNLDPSQLTEISAVENKRPQRKDWSFTFADKNTYQLSEGEPRIMIQIAGDKVVDKAYYIHIPEQWTRDNLSEKNLISIITHLCTLLFFVFFLLGIAALFKNAQRFHFSKYFISLFSLLFLLSCLSFFNILPKFLATFNTQEPFFNQFFRIISGSLLGALTAAAFYAYIIVLINNWKTHSPMKKNYRTVLLGVSIGLIFVGLSSIIKKYAPSIEPQWADYSMLGSYIPLLGVLFATISHYISITISFLLLLAFIDYSEKKWNSRLITSVLLLLIGFIYTTLEIVNAGIQPLTTLPFWFISGLVFGCTLLVIYRFILRFDHTLLPLITGTFIIMKMVQQGIFNAYPSALLATGTTIIMICCLSLYWFKKLDR